MSEITTVGLDLAKNVFQLHGVDGVGRAVLRRGQVPEVLADMPRCTVAMAARGRGALLGPGSRQAGPRGSADPVLRYERSPGAFD